MLGLFLALLAPSPAPAADDLALGKRLFESQCALCHGIDGKGGRGPSLARPRLDRAPDDDALRKVISRGITDTEMPGAWQLSPREIASVASYVRSLAALAPEVVRGDATRGSAIYRDRGCAGCHIIGGQGTSFGPELTAIGASRSAAFLRESITKPAAAAPDGFLLVEVVTASGETVRGIRRNEDSFTLQLQTIGRAFRSFRKLDLKDFRKITQESPMPAFDTLPSSDLDDLTAYLVSLKGNK